MDKPKKVIKKNLTKKLEKAYVEMRNKSKAEKQSRDNCPCGCKGKCVCGRGK